ncbi:MAG TPA: SUMF1/EgtB/PvdO family nonheme iron enzyme, partial [Armatimonadota bacterium]|nr:SUMF1/EgtB/PvdO family nonheme iron enzyme [Armatimonadota bacterium]
MKKVFGLAAAIALLCLGSIAQANITVDTVPVGDPGNAGELSGGGAGGYGPDRICGSVAYNYNIGKYEVTAGQYADFLNKVAVTDTYGLYNTSMWSSSYGCKIQQSGSPGTYTYSVASDWANRPVNYVSYWDSCRFANWLHNGQPTGIQTAATTERGVYTLDDYNGDDGRTIQRNANWKWAV